MNQKTTRTELFSALESLSSTVPDMRAGQLIAALGELCADTYGRGLWDVTDEELHGAVAQFRRGCEMALVLTSREA